LNSTGHRLLLQGRYAEAEPLLRRAVALGSAMPTRGYTLYNLGWCLLARGKAEEAVEPLRRSAELQPSRWEPQQRLGEAYERLGKDESAKAAFARAKDLRGGRYSRERGSRDRAAAPPAVRTLLTDAAYQATYYRREELFLGRAAGERQEGEHSGGN